MEEWSHSQATALDDMRDDVSAQHLQIPGPISDLQRGKSDDICLVFANTVDC